MPVIAVKTELKCKLCRSAERSQVDALLEKRARREKDESGVRVTADYILRRLGEWGIENPKLDNIKNHWQKHCELVSKEEWAARQAAAAEVVDAFKSGDVDSIVVGADEALDFIITQGMREAHVRIQADGKAGVTVDQVLKAIDAKTRRKHNEAQDELLKGLGRGLEAAFTKALGTGPAPVIEGEIVREIEEATLEQ